MDTVTKQDTIMINHDDFNQICSMANRFGWTPGGIDGSFTDAIRFISEALNTRIELLDETVAAYKELEAANARLQARMDAAMAIPAKVTTLDGVSSKARGYNAARDEFRKALTGAGEG